MPICTPHSAARRRWTDGLTRTVVPVLLLLMATGCLSDAKHSNPLDPDTPGYREVGSIEGRATRFYPPHPPIEDAEIRLSPGPYVARSGADGTFVFDGIPAGSYQITAKKDGFRSFTDTVTVSLGSRTTDVRIPLNGMPVVAASSIRTIHVSRWWPQEDLYVLEISADVLDPDGVGDITSAWVEIPSFDFVLPLAETGVVGRYGRTVPADSLPVPSLHVLEGVDLMLHAQDAVGFVNEPAPETIVRVIDYVPVAVDPQGLATVEDGRPHLAWEDAALPYGYTYRIDIVRDEANVQAVIETITDIPSDVTSYVVEGPLMQGTYFWTVSVVDSFGNRSRSKEAGFVVP